MSTIYIQEAVNIFVGDAGPDNSKHLIITDTTLPVLEEMTMKHRAGGSIGEIEIGGLGINSLTLGFKLGGVDPQSMSQFGIGGAGLQNYTVYGAVRDKQTGILIEMKTIVRGRLVKVDSGTFKRGDMAEQTHEIKEIFSYQLWWNKNRKYYYDFFASTWEVDGVDQNSDTNGILRIAG